MVNDGERRRLALELGIASEDNAFEAGFLNQGELSPFSCPECNGAMVRLKEGGVLRFRCHTGHAYSQQTLLAAVRVETEAKLWQAVRVLDESVMLLEHLARHYEEAGLDGDARAFAEEAQRTRTRSVRVRQEALQSTEVTRLPPDDVPPDETQPET